MSFKIVGKGVFSKEVLIEKLLEWGIEIENVLTVVKEAERKGRIECGKHRIMLVR